MFGSYNFAVYTFISVRCHSNETDAQIWKLSQGARLESSSKHCPKLHWNTCSSVGMHHQTDTDTGDHYTFGIALPNTKCNYACVCSSRRPSTGSVRDRPASAASAHSTKSDAISSQQDKNQSPTKPRKVAPSFLSLYQTVDLRPVI